MPIDKIQKGYRNNSYIKTFIIFVSMFLEILKMTRPLNIAIAIVTLAVGYFLLCETSDEFCLNLVPFILQAFGFAFAIGFANIQNDILDYDSDLLNRPERALPAKRISLRCAKRAWITMFVAMIACGIAISILEPFNFIPFIFFTLISLLLIAYNKKIKHIPLLKNMTVAFLCTTPLILCLIYPSSPKELDNFTTKLGILYPAMLFAFLLTTAREIYKDLEDEIGDLKAGIMTFPLIAGTKTASHFAEALLFFTWILLPLPVVQGFYPILFVILTGATLTPCFAYIIIQAGQKKNYSKAQKITKLAMFIGLVSLVLSVIF